MKFYKTVVIFSPKFNLSVNGYDVLKRNYGTASEDENTIALRADGLFSAHDIILTSPKKHETAVCGCRLIPSSYYLLTYALSSKLEHGPSSKALQRLYFFGSCSTSFQFIPIAFISFLISLLKVLFWRSLLLLPCGFHCNGNVI